MELHATTEQDIVCPNCGMDCFMENGEFICTVCGNCPQCHSTNIVTDFLEEVLKCYDCEWEREPEDPNWVMQQKICIL